MLGNKSVYLPGTLLRHSLESKSMKELRHIYDGVCKKLADQMEIDILHDLHLHDTIYCSGIYLLWYLFNNQLVSLGRLHIAASKVDQMWEAAIQDNRPYVPKLEKVSCDLPFVHGRLASSKWNKAVGSSL